MDRRVLLFTVLCAALSSAVYAQGPSHVRVLWDVEEGLTCMLVRPLADPDKFELPSAWPCTPKPLAKPREQCTAKWCSGHEALLRKGDYVTVYAFNYNAVSYKALAPVVTTLKPEDPVAISLLAAVLKLPGFPTQWTIAIDRDVPTPPCHGTPQNPLDPPKCLTEIKAAIALVQTQVEMWEAKIKPEAEAIAAARPGIPAKLKGKKPAYPTNFDIAHLDSTGVHFLSRTAEGDRWLDRVA